MSSQSLPWLHMQSMKVDEGSNKKKTTHLAAHSHSKNHMISTIISWTGAIDYDYRTKPNIDQRFYVAENKFYDNTTISVIMSAQCGPLPQAYRACTKRPLL